MAHRWDRRRRSSIKKDDKKKNWKDANSVYRGILRDRAKRRYSKPNIFKALGKILTFDWDLFITDISAIPLEKSSLKYGRDYLILRGNFSGRIARYVGTKTVKKYASFCDVRGNEIRVNCNDPGFGTIPKLGCWMELLSLKERIFTRPPILLLQAKSVIGDIPTDVMHFAIREQNNLIAQFSYRNGITPECIDLPRIEETIVKLGSHSKAHSALKLLVKRGFYVCYEDDGWLVKCDSTARIRFMRRSHTYCITICRCGRDVVNAMMNDYTLRTLLPVRMFAGLCGVKQKQRPGHLRRSSSIMGSFDQIDFSDLIDDYDKSACYARIFNREGAVDGNCLCLDTPFLDAIRSYIDNGGLARNCIVPNIVKWRKMIKSAAGGDDPYLLMGDIRIANCQWSDVMNALPNSRYRRYSFSVIFYDGTTKQDSPKISHKILSPIRPKDDIIATFRNKLYMNGSYLCIALSRRNVNDDSLPILFDNVEEFVYKSSNKYGYIARRVALGVHIDKQIYVDFQIFVKSVKKKKKKRKKKKIKSNDDQKYNDSSDDDDDVSSLSDDDDDDDSSDDESSSELIQSDDQSSSIIENNDFYDNTYNDDHT